MKKLSKQEYANKMKQQREEIFSLCNKQLKVITSDPYHFTNFLSLMASTNYTVNNSLLVYGQRPHATELRTLEKWAEKDIQITKGEKGIKIMEPSTEYTRKDGSKGMNYSMKYVFDISQTNASRKEFVFNKDAIRSGLIDSSCHIVVTSDSSQLTPVEYDSSSNQINVLENISDDEELNGLFKAYALKDSLKTLDRNKADFISNCVGYMLSIRFHIPNYNTVRITALMDKYFKNKDEQEIRNELNQIYRVYKPIKEKINYGIYAYKKS